MDNRLIEERTDLEFSAELLKLIKPVIYRQKGGKSGIGIEAQELETILPVLVKHSPNAPRMVDYEKLSVVLISVIQELNNRIEALESRPKRKQK